MKILAINGNPKKGGFIADSLAVLSARLTAQNVEVQELRLADAHIADCIGCFHCLKTGACTLSDDMDHIIPAMAAADGFVVGSPVRNETVTACYKRFYERITYLLGFPLLLEEKYTLGISCVGYMGGKGVNKQFVGLQGMHTCLSDFLFYRVGIPTHLQAADMREKLERAADKLIADIGAHRPQPLFGRVSAAAERLIMRKFMFEKHPEVYRYVIDCWQKKGYM